MPIFSSAEVQVASTASFTYTPPKAAIAAERILVKHNLGYPVKPPVTVSVGVLGEVLRGLRQASASAEILIVEGVCSPVSLAEIISRNGVCRVLDEGMRVLDADTLPLA